MGWKTFLLGEKMPDKNDPQYKERYEREVAAGRRFADAVGITWLVGKIQVWGQAHKVSFLVIVLGFIFSVFVYNLVNLVIAYRQSGTPNPVSVERIGKAMQQPLRSND